MNRREVTRIQENRAPEGRAGPGVVKRAFRQAARLAVAGIMAVSLGCGSAPKKLQVASSAEKPPVADAGRKEGKMDAKPGIIEENPYGEAEAKEEKAPGSRIKDCPY